MPVHSIIGWCAGLIFGSILLAWITINSGWSIIPVIIWHRTFDTITASDQVERIIAGIMSMSVIVLTIFICKKYGVYLIVRSTKKGIAKAYEISYAIFAVLNSAMTFLAKQKQICLFIRFIF